MNSVSGSGTAVAMVSGHCALSPASDDLVRHVLLREADPCQA